MNSQTTKYSRPALWGFFIAFTAIALLFGARMVWSSYVDSHWQSINESEKVEFQRAVESAYAQRITELSRVVTAIQKDSVLLQGLNDNREETAAGLFRALDNFRPESNITLDITDAQGDVVVWAGRSIQQNYRAQFLHDRSESSAFISQSGLHTYLTVGASVGRRSFYVLASRPLEFSFPIANRFVSNESFTEEMSRKLGVKVSLDIAGVEHSNGIEKNLRVALRNFAGTAIAFVSVAERPREAAIQNISAIINKWAGLFLSAGIVCLGFFICGQLRSFKPRIVFVVTATVTLWAGRFIWRAVDFPGSIIGGPLFDPSMYASPFGFGIASSVGELFVTLVGVSCTIAVWLNAVLLYRTHRQERRGRANPAIMVGRFFALLVLTTVILLVTRGYVAAIRSYVFDSVIQFHNPSIIVPGFLAVAMHINILILSTCYLCIFLIILIMMRMTAALVTFRRSIEWVLPIVLILAGAPLFLSIDDTSVIPFYFPLLAFFVSLLLFLWIERRKLPPEESFDLPSLVVVVLASFFISTPMLDAKLHEKERERVELFANDLLKPADDWLSFVLLDGVRSISSRITTLRESAPLSSENDEHIAFWLWTQTLLGKQGYNSAAVFYDAKGKETDRFAVGINDFEQREVLTKLFQNEEESIQVVEHSLARNRVKSYGVWSTLRDSTKHVVGSVALILSAGQRSFFRGDAPEPLRSTAFSDFDTGFRQTAQSEFQNGLLAWTTNPHWYPGYRVPAHVEKELDLPANRLIWDEETIDGVSFETLFARDPGQPGKISAVSLEVLDLRWHLFNLVKVFVVYALVLVALGIVNFAVAKLKGIHLAFSFRSKLFLAFALISVIPLILLGYYNRQVVTERVEQNVEQDLANDLNLINRRILESVNDDDDFVNGVNDDYCESVASEYGADFSVFRRFSLLASSRPELYRASILDNRLSGEAFANTVLLRKDFFVSTEQVGTVTYAVGYKPLFVDGRLAGVLAIPALYRQKEIDEELAQRNAFVLGAYALVFGLITIVGGILAGRIARPLRELTEAAREIGTGNLEVELKPRSSDEVGMLVESFNQMAKELKRSRGELARAARESAWREMAKQVAHEIKNPLTPMKLSMQHLRQAFKDKKADREALLRKITQTVIDQIDVLSRIATEFSNFARMPERKFERLNVQALLRESITLFSEIKQIEFRSKFSDTDVEIVADRDEVRRVFINIIRNGVQAMERGGTLTVESKMRDHRCLIRISDTGSGIPPEVRERIFEPNFSTKTDGTGLGLAIAQRIIHDLGGTIKFESQVDKGTTFEIELPV